MRKGQPGGGRNANASAHTVIAIPESGTQPSSIRFRKSHDATPKPKAIPSDAAAINIEDIVPKPWPPWVSELATFTDHRLMNEAKPQKYATPKDARRSPRSRQSSPTSLKWLMSSFPESLPAPCAGTFGIESASATAGTERHASNTSGNSAASHAFSGSEPSEA